MIEAQMYFIELSFSYLHSHRVWLIVNEPKKCVVCDPSVKAGAVIAAKPINSSDPYHPFVALKILKTFEGSNMNCIQTRRFINCMDAAISTLKKCAPFKSIGREELQSIIEMCKNLEIWLYNGYQQLNEQTAKRFQMMGKLLDFIRQLEEF